MNIYGLAYMNKFGNITLPNGFFMVEAFWYLETVYPTDGSILWYSSCFTLALHLLFAIFQATDIQPKSYRHGRGGSCSILSSVKGKSVRDGVEIPATLVPRMCD